MTYLVIILTYLCFSNALAMTPQPMEIEPQVPLETLPPEVLQHVFAQRLEQDNLMGSIRSLWKTRETNIRFQSVITPHNIVLWIKDRDIGLVEYTNADDPLAPYQQFLTPLMQAIRAHDYDVMKLLIGGGQNVNETNPDNLTPLLVAADQEDITAMKILLSTKGIDVDKETKNNYTALSTLIAHLDSQPEMYFEVVSLEDLLQIIPLILLHNPRNLSSAINECKVPAGPVRRRRNDTYLKACKLLDDYIAQKQSSKK